MRYLLNPAAHCRIGARLCAAGSVAKDVVGYSKRRACILGGGNGRLPTSQHCLMHSNNMKDCCNRRAQAQRQRMAVHTL